MSNKKIAILVLFAGIIGLTEACKPPSSSKTGTVRKIERPRDAWVLRSVLDQKPRMLSAFLHDKMLVAYNTQTGGLYKAWHGSINFAGPVYTAAHGPQPTSQGSTYFEEPDTIPWRIRQDGQETIPRIIYKGHSILDNQLTVTYNLVYQGHEIAIAERPEYVDLNNGRTSLERSFTTSGVPANVQVILKMHLASIKTEADITADQPFKVLKKKNVNILQQQFLEVDGELALMPNKQTNITVAFTPKPLVASLPQEKLQGEAAVMAIMAKSDCNTCHNRDVKTVGPAYKDIADKYLNTPQNLETLVRKVADGGAGNWGEIPMTPHPDLSKAEASTMVAYILNLDRATEKKNAANSLLPKPNFTVTLQPLDPAQIKGKQERPGIAFNAYAFNDRIFGFPQISPGRAPNFSGLINALHLDKNGFGALKDNFVVHATGFLHMDKTTNVVFRLLGDDGARLFIDNQLVVESVGNLRAVAKDAEVIIKKGKTPFRVEYFQRGAGKTLSLQWLPYGAKEFTVVPPSVFVLKESDIKKVQPLAAKRETAPGDGAFLQGVHPGFTLTQARPAAFQPKVGGMDFLADGRLVVSTWDSLGAVYILEGVGGLEPEKIKVKRIAFGLAEPLGLKVVDNEIFVLQKQELTKLVDVNKDDIIDEYQSISYGWQVSANFHEFAFGLVYQDGYFYGTLATAINPGGASTNPQIPDRGKVIRIAKKDGAFSFVASGLRTPNGIGIGVDKEIFIADNQGDWLPANKIVHLRKGAWYGSRSVDFEGTAFLTETLPVVWLPQDEIANSPSQPTLLHKGIYKNQMLYGDVTHGGIKRIFVEKVNNAYQGAVFRFTQGLEAGVNRLMWGPDSALYIGGVGSTGSWAQAGKLKSGLQKLKFNNKPAFEMLAIRARNNGIEIEFTEPLREGSGTKATDYHIQQWRYNPTANYGGPKLDEAVLPLKNIILSDDRRKVFLEIDGIKKQHVLYVRLNRLAVLSATGEKLWATEAWYTMNNIPGKPY